MNCSTNTIGLLQPCVEKRIQTGSMLPTCPGVILYLVRFNWLDKGAIRKPQNSLPWHGRIYAIISPVLDINLDLVNWIQIMRVRLVKCLLLVWFHFVVVVFQLELSENRLRIGKAERSSAKVPYVSSSPSKKDDEAE
jgi:hypothetical protein